MALTVDGLCNSLCVRRGQKQLQQDQLQLLRLHRGQDHQQLLRGQGQQQLLLHILIYAARSRFLNGHSGCFIYTRQEE